LRCIVCNSTDKWENVDHVRNKPAGMHICTNCGFTSYPSKWQSKEAILEHYRKNYRQPPTHANVFTGQRKLHFHEAFLGSVFEEWKTKGLKPQITEIGAAFGMALAWLRARVPGAQVEGTELTTSFRRVAQHEYNIKLTEDFDDTKTYDLIMSYKVAEHQLDADKELRRYALCLKETGYLYISVPIWFTRMHNFGATGFSMDYYYDPNHINVWTRKHFEGLLKKAGLEIVKQDHVLYDSTYLCKRNDALMNEAVEFENPEEIKAKMMAIKNAKTLYDAGKYEEAIAAFPDFPVAHVNKLEMTRKQVFEKGWEYIKEHVIEPAQRACPGCYDISVMATDLAMRANKWEEALKYCEIALQQKPETPTSLSQLIYIYREMAIQAGRMRSFEEESHYFAQAISVAKHLRNVSLQSQSEATDRIFEYAACIPTESELQAQVKAAS